MWIRRTDVVVERGGGGGLAEADHGSADVSWGWLRMVPYTDPRCGMQSHSVM